jgi:hypothetical protein
LPYQPECIRSVVVFASTREREQFFFHETAPPRWTFSLENVSASARVHEHLAAVAQAELHPHLGVA